MTPMSRTRSTGPPSLTMCRVSRGVFRWRTIPRPARSHRSTNPRNTIAGEITRRSSTRRTPGELLDWVIPVPWTLSSKTLRAVQAHADDRFRCSPIGRSSRAINLTDPSIHDVTLVNWPQNDYCVTNLIDQARRRSSHARWMNRNNFRSAWCYWLQTEQGYPMLYLRPDIAGTKDGLAKYPYIRESRRIRAIFTVTENHVATECRFGDNPDDAADRSLAARRTVRRLRRHRVLPHRSSPQHRRTTTRSTSLRCHFKSPWAHCCPCV